MENFINEQMTKMAVVIFAFSFTLAFTSCSEEYKAKRCVKEFVKANIEKDEDTCRELFPQMKNIPHASFDKDTFIGEVEVQDSHFVVPTGKCILYLTKDENGKFIIFDSKDFLNYNDIHNICLIDNPNEFISFIQKTGISKSGQTDLGARRLIQQYIDSRKQIEEKGSIVKPFDFDFNKFVAFIINNNPKACKDFCECVSYTLIGSNGRESEYELVLKSRIEANIKCSIDVYTSTGEKVGGYLEEVGFTPNEIHKINMSFNSPANQIGKIKVSLYSMDNPTKYLGYLKKIVNFSGDEYKEYLESKEYDSWRDAMRRHARLLKAQQKFLELLMQN